MKNFFAKPFLSKNQLYWLLILVALWFSTHLTYRWIFLNNSLQNISIKYPERPKMGVIPKNNNNSTLLDINTASADSFQHIKGIGKVISNRIIKYRTRLQGFTFIDQIDEIWGLSPKLIQEIKRHFMVKGLPEIKKTNINDCAFKELLSHPYIDYALCKKIFNYKSHHGKFKDLSQLKKIKGFPLNKYDRIALYLSL